VLKVWGRTNSINVQKVMWCAGELGLAHERVDLGRQYGSGQQDWYLAMNPMGLVPCIDDEGFTLWESNAIVRYLAAKHGLGSLCPKPFEARADADRWMDWQLSSYLAPINTIFWALIRPTEYAEGAAALEKAKPRAEQLCALLDRHLEGRGYMLGTDFTMADIPVGATAHRWYALDVPHPELPNLRAWYDRLLQRPAFRQHVAEIPLS